MATNNNNNKKIEIEKNLTTKRNITMSNEKELYNSLDDEGKYYYCQIKAHAHRFQVEGDRSGWDGFQIQWMLRLIAINYSIRDANEIIECLKLEKYGFYKIV